MKPVVPLPELPKEVSDYAETVRNLSGPKAWKSFKGNCRNGYETLQGDLNKRQRGLCAYCEIDLVAPRRKPKDDQKDIPDVEVEHFHPKHRDEDGTRWVFEPGNLFLSCRNNSHGTALDDRNRVDSPASCGPFKGGKNPDDEPINQRPLRPSEIPAARSVVSIDLQNGCITSNRENCDAEDVSVSRVDATIGFFNLDCPRLRRARAGIIPGLADQLLFYMEQFTEDDVSARRMMAEDTLLAGGDGSLPPFFSTIREFLQPEAEDVLAAAPERWLDPAD